MEEEEEEEDEDEDEEGSGEEEKTDGMDRGGSRKENGEDGGGMESDSGGGTRRTAEDPERRRERETRRGEENWRDGERGERERSRSVLKRCNSSEESLACGQDGTTTLDKGETLGQDPVSAMELMRAVRELCGGLIACRATGERTFEVTMTHIKGILSLQGRIVNQLDVAVRTQKPASSDQHSALPGEARDVDQKEYCTTQEQNPAYSTHMDKDR